MNSPNLVSFFLNIETKTCWIELGQLGLTCEIRDLGHKIDITL
jgi:hypothetical protein